MLDWFQRETKTNPPHFGVPYFVAHPKLINQKEGQMANPRKDEGGFFFCSS